MTRRTVRRVIGAATLIVTTLAAMPSSSIPVDAQTTTTTLALVQQTPFVGPDGTFRVELSIGDLPADTRLSLTVHAQIANRSQLERTMAGEQLGATITATTALAPPRGAGTFALSLPVSATWPAPAGGAVLSNAGVYPVTVDATRADGTRVDRLVTHLLRLPAADTVTDPLEVGTVVTIDATPTIALDGSATLSESDLARTRGQLSIVDDPTVAPPLTLSASPFVLSMLRDDGVALDTKVSSRSTLSTPWVAIDAGSLAAARQETTIVDEYRAGDATLTALLGIVPDRRVTVIDGLTTPRVLDLTAARGTNSLVLDSTQIRSSLVTGDTGVLTQRFLVRSESGTPFTAMASDDLAGVPFAFGRDPVLSAHQALAHLAMVHFEQPGSGRGIALTLPSVTSPAALREFLNGLTQRSGATSGSVGSPIVDPVTLGDLFASTTIATDRNGPIVRTWTSDEPADLGSYTPALEEARWNFLGLRSLLPDDPTLTDPVERTILTSAARFLMGADRSSSLAAADRSTRALATAVSIPSTQSVTLTSQSGDIPLSFENALPTGAHVRITVSSPKLDFPDGSTLDLVVAPGSSSTTIRATTRASGAFPMQVSVASIDGVLPVASSTIDVRSTAISGWGLVLSIGAGLFLAVWWIRHFRHTRRARTLIDVDTDLDDAETRSAPSR